MLLQPENSVSDAEAKPEWQQTSGFLLSMHFSLISQSCSLTISTFDSNMLISGANAIVVGLNTAYVLFLIQF